MGPFEELNALELFDFALLHFDRGRLVVAGSRDFSYYHNAEIRFFEVEHIHCAAGFSHARFRVASDDECRRLRSEIGGFGGTAFWIETEFDDGRFERRHFVVAASVEVEISTTVPASVTGSGAHSS